MNVIIDTSSLLALVRYYLPFDAKYILKDFINQKFDSGEILILDKVYEEATYISQKQIIKELTFINDTTKHIKTIDILPNSTFFNLLENQFCDKDIKKLKDISDTEFELEKSKYLNSADAKMILYALRIKQDNPIIVTEETRKSNDNKLFKKLPENCYNVKIECCNLPFLLKELYKLNIGSYIF